MWPTSTAFNTALLSSTRKWASKVEVLYGSDVVVSLNTLMSGYIGMDEVAVRREAHVTFDDADGVLTPVQASDLLTPKGTEMRIYRGLWTGADYEWVPLGVFGIVEPEVRSHSEGVVVQVKGFDRVDKLRTLRFVDPWIIADGTPFHTAIAAIIADRLPDVQVRVTTSAYTTPALTFDRLSSPWDAIDDLCDASGYIAYFDPLGTAVVEPNVGRPTGVTYTIGPQSVLMNVTRKFLPTEQVYSGVVVRGEHPDHAPIRSELWDTNPNSPTYSDGPFGKRPYGVYSDSIVNDVQAAEIAAVTLPLVTQMKQECEITTRGTPGHEIGDVITIIDPRSSTSGEWKIISATVPLVTEQGAHVRLRCREA
jgi:hypothetical protein